MNNLVRRILTILLVGILISSLVIGFLWLRIRVSPGISPEQTVPENFIACLETNDFMRFRSALQDHSNIWSEFQNYDDIIKLDSLLHEIDSLSRSVDELKILLDGTLLISLYEDSTGIGLLFSMNSPENKATDLLLKHISNKAEIDQMRFENKTIYRVRYPGQDKYPFSFTEYRGVFIMSFSSTLIKRAIIQSSKSENVFKLENYTELQPTLGDDVEAHIYFDFDRLEGFLNRFVAGEGKISMSKFSSQTAIDLELKPNQIVLNGFSSGTDSAYYQMDVFEGQTAVEQKLLPFIPATSVYIKWKGISSINNYREKSDQFYAIEEKSREFRDKFFEQYGGQAAEIVVKRSSNSYYNLAVISIKSKGQAEDFIVNELEKEADILESFELNIDDKIRQKAYKIPGKPQNINNHLSDIISDENYKWISFYSNNMILASSTRDLRDYMYLNYLGKTMQNDDYFQEMKDNFSSRSNFFIYFDPSQYYDQFSRYLDPEITRMFERNPESWRKINLVGFQATRSGEMSYFRLFVNYSGQIREFVNTVWERKLEGNVQLKPAIVINHNNREKEIFLQDDKNNIYLISNTGGILWKQPVDGPILSDVFQVDYYNNGKLQYLFNTAQKLYLIDRNGNSVEKYPVQLREKASAGIRLFDYDNNRNFRIPVPTVEKNILMYDLPGNIVSGWNFRGSDHVVRSPLIHARIGNKDYIIAKDDFRIYFLNRRGKIRLKPDKQIDFSKNNDCYFIREGDNSRILASGLKGDVYAFYFNGKVEKILEHEASENHYFLTSDLDGNRDYEYIFADSTRLMVINNDEELFTEIYPENISYKPTIYSFSSTDKKIGIVVGDEERIYLLNNDGLLYNGFPLRGASLFSISSFPGLKDRFNLIVGNEDNFLYNYTVK